ncbi:hypothetical protein SAMN05216263_12454 [Metapseudomonas otitidis]|nr:hypothetical protein SAMN05216263_12454 [Pseudomonas otitidis]
MPTPSSPASDRPPHRTAPPRSPGFSPGAVHGPGLKSGLPTPRRCTRAAVPNAVGGWKERHPPHNRVPGLKSGLPVPRRCTPVGWIALHRSTVGAMPGAIGKCTELLPRSLGFSPGAVHGPGLKSGLPAPRRCTLDALRITPYKRPKPRRDALRGLSASYEPVAPIASWHMMAGERRRVDRAPSIHHRSGAERHWWRERAPSNLQPGPRSEGRATDGLARTPRWGHSPFHPGPWPVRRRCPGSHKE